MINNIKLNLLNHYQRIFSQLSSFSAGSGLCIENKSSNHIPQGRWEASWVRKILQVVPDSLEQVLCPVLILGSRVLVPEDDIQEVGEGVSALLPYNIEIRLPEDESQLLSQKNRLEGDMKMVQFEDNKNQSIPHEPQYHCIFAGM